MSNDTLMQVVFWGGCAWFAVVLFECAFRTWLAFRRKENNDE
jgi:hypothetical protein